MRRQRGVREGRAFARVATVLVTAAVLTGAGPVGGAAAAAQPSPTAPPGEPPAVEVPEPVPGEEVCTITDSRLLELSGMVATDDGYIVVNDSQDFDDRLPIFFLNQSCEVIDQQDFLPGRPSDPEGLELDRGAGVLWVGDTGDNVAGGFAEGEPRPHVALWSVNLADGADRTPVIYRFLYPDQPRDAEALLLDAEGTPVIVTRALGAAAELYRPTELRPSTGFEDRVALEKVGEVSLPDSGSEHAFLPSAAARQVVTGGAVSPDGSAVVLRSYTDAFEFDVTDGDVVAAITEGEPRITPLPDEPLGEAITYSPDGQHFLTVSEVSEELDDTAPLILRYTPTPPSPDPPPVDEAAAPESGGGGFSLFSNVQDVINLIAAVGVVGLLLVAVGVYGIVRARRRPPGAAAGAGEEPDGGDGEPGAVPAGSPVQGRARLTGDAEHAGVYTSSAAADYGGAEYGGTEYGGEYPEAGTGGGGYGGGEYRGPESGGGEYRGGEYRGTEYGGDGYAEGYPDQPYDQEWPQGGDGRGWQQSDSNWPQSDSNWPQSGGNRPQSGGGYPPGYADGPADAYRGGRSAQPAADRYSDDPDYPYQFRDRW